MKKISIFFLVFALIFVLTSCAAPAQAPVSPTQAEDEPTTQAEKEKPVVVIAEQTKIPYSCDQCAGDCSYYTGYFRCAAIDRQSEDAVAINEAIKSNFDKYLAAANAMQVSGLAYGFDFAAGYADKQYLILRTAIETVLLHNGGTYSYDFYYYDLKNDCNAEIADVCNAFGLDVNVIAAYLRIELAEQNSYGEGQLAGINPSCMDIFPSSDGESYYVRVQNDQLKYETYIKSADLNSRAEEIASMLTEIPIEIDSSADENAEEATEQATTEQDVIYMEY